MKRNSTFLIVALCLLAAATASAADQPNILFLFADDWGRHASIYAEVDGPGTMNDTIQTPHFDALAREGVLFNNAYVSSPSCTPCRSALMSGQHFWRTGTGAVLTSAWDDSNPAYPLLLEKAGYHIGFANKVWGPGAPMNAPHGGERAKYNKAGRSICHISYTVAASVKKGKSLEEAKQNVMSEVRQNFRDFLAAREDGKPFCFLFGPTTTHRKWLKGSGATQWGTDPIALKGKLPPFLPDVPEVREDLNDYFGQAMAFDMAIGALLDELKQTGEYENTIIAVSGDHGAPGFPHGKCNLYDFGSRVPLVLSGPGVTGGRVVEDFVTLPDLAPTFLEAGNVAVPEAMTAQSLWTVLESDAEGWVDASRTQVYIGRERHVPTARAGNLPYPQRAIRTRDHLFIINFKPDRYPIGDPYKLDTPEEPDADAIMASTKTTLPDEDASPTKAWLVTHRKDPAWRPYFDRAYGKRPRLELYDLKKDPHQINNVAMQPEYRTVVKRLQNHLMTELETTGDPRLVDDGRYFEEQEKFSAALKAEISAF
ncbi:Arylsulfatase [Planctomycetes bacterium CA13]|uniref:Arylsulfatase n=1 Tax=Novipirellula herctigrandis TaxID=2527986 RepID=A0A5C5YZ38_9BACT|nr:Arylsulfatase [Planctomycetes bacterium CA13]